MRASSGSRVFTWRVRAWREGTMLAVAMLLSFALIAETAVALPPDPPAVQEVDTLCAAMPSDFEPFVDLAGNEQDIECLSFAAITRGGPRGAPANEYGPRLVIERDEMASFLVRLLDLKAGLSRDGNTLFAPAEFDGANSFSDVAVDSPHMDAINRLARVGIVTGGPGGLPADRYGPNDQVTRAQLASMLVRAENFLLAGDASTAAYPAAPDYFIDDDGRRSAPHEDNINRITHAGIVAGAPSGLSDPVTDPFTGEVIDCGEADVDCYGPGLGTTRSQMASFLVRLMGDNVEQGHIDPLPEEPSPPLTTSTTVPGGSGGGGGSTTTASSTTTTASTTTTTTVPIKSGVVPNVVSDTNQVAISKIDDSGFAPALSDTKSSNTVPAGRVISQSQAPGTELDAGSEVAYVLSSGPELVVVPNVVGYGEIAASAEIAGAGLTVGKVGETTSDAVAEGQVDNQLPLPAQRVRPGTPVDVELATGSVNHPPEIVSTPFEEPIVEGDEYSYNAHASDPDDGDDLTWVLQAGPDEADIDSDSGDVTWTPGEGDAGDHDLVIRVEDGYGGIDVQSWTVTVTRPNGKPIATDDVHAVHIGQQLVVGAPEGVLSNDTDPDGDALTAAVVSQPTNGTVEMAPDGGFTYAPRETTSPDRVYSDIDLTAATGVVVTSEIPTWAARPLERLVDGLDRTAWWAQGTLQPPLAVTLTFGADVSVDRIDVIGSKEAGGFSVDELTLRFFDAGGSLISELVEIPGAVDNDPDYLALDPDVSIDVEELAGGAVSGVRRVDVVFTELERGYPIVGELRVFGDGPILELAPKLEWSVTEYEYEEGEGQGYAVASMPVVADLDQDGIPEILAVANQGFLEVRNGRTGALQWKREAAPSGAPVAAADLVGDAELEVVAANPVGDGLIVYGHDGAVLAATPLSGVGMTKVAIADLDADGQAEIVVGSWWGATVSAISLVEDDSGVSLVHEWQTQNAGCGNGAFPSCGPVVGDIDLDGSPEIVTANAVYDSEGGLVGAVPGVTQGYVALGNFDDDPEAEIVIASRATVRILNHDLSLMWGPVQVPTNASQESSAGGGPPTVADFDGDGRPEVGTAGRTHYVVFDPDEDGDDSVLWTNETIDISSAVTGSTVFDFDNDGSAEVVYRDEQNLYIWNGSDGALRYRRPFGSVTHEELPVVADVDADGHAEIVVTADAPRTDAPETGLFVLGGPADSWVRARSIWNQHSYHVTNVNADGSIPRVEKINWLTPGLNNFRQNAFLPDEVPRLDQFTYSASDGTEADEATVFVDVLPPENDPSFTCGPALTAVVGFAYTSRVCGADVDAGDTLTYSAQGGPAVDPESGLVTWAPGEAELGTTTVVFTVTDSTGRTASAVHQITVSQPAIVPDLVGLELDDAADVVHGADPALRLGKVVVRSHPTIAADIVLEQHPPAGAATEVDTAVQLTVSSGPSIADRDDDDDGYTPNQGDCNDDDSAINPGATEVDDGVDQDCDGEDGLLDVDGISITGSVSDLVVGRTRSFFAQATLLDGRTVDITHLATWGATPTSRVAVAGRTVRALAPGEIEVTATFAGLSASLEMNVIADAVADDVAPVAEIDSPLPGDEIAATLVITGRAGDDNLTGWAVTVVDAAGTELGEIGRGTAAVDGELGSIASGALPPGLVTVRLDVEDAGGNISRVEVPVMIDDGAQVGAFSLPFTDLVVPASGVPLSVVRTYDSRDGRDGDFGAGWTLDVTGMDVSVTRDQGLGWEQSPGRWSTTLQPTADHTVMITLPDGRREMFDLVPHPRAAVFIPVSRTQAAYQPRRGTTGTLVPRGDRNLIVLPPSIGPVELVDDGDLTPYQPTDGFVYTRNDGTEFTIDAAGDVEKIVDPNGNTITITDDGIIHSAGASVEFERDALGRIVAVTDPEGERQTYTYDARGDLVAHTDREGNTTRFRYADPHKLVEVMDPLGRPLAKLEYDDLGRLVASTDPTGRRVEMEHQVDSNTELLKNGDGTQKVVQYDGDGNVITEIDELGRRITRTFDEDGNRTSETDDLGNTTTHAYGEQGLETLRTDAEGNATEWRYDARGRMTAVVLPGGATTTYERDSAGNLLRETGPGGAVRGYSYDGQGNLLTATDATGATSQYEHDAAGNQVRETAPDGTVTRRLFDRNGNVREVTVDTGDGPVTVSTTLNANGQPTRLVDAAGNTSTATYDWAGSVASAVGPDGASTTYEYGLDGRQTATVLPGGARVESSYDARGRMDGVTDLDGDETVFLYDAASQPTALLAPDATPSDLDDNPRRTLDYDAAGRLTDVGVETGGAVGLVYDDAGRVVGVSDVAGPATRSVLDARGRIVEEIDQLNRSTTYVYDDADNLTNVTFPDATTRSFTHDAEGRVVTETDEAGKTWSYEYDVVGQLVRVEEPTGAVTTYEYDDLGNPTSMTDALGRATRFEHDERGLVTAVVRPDGSRETRAYDEAGRLVERVDANGDVTTIGHDDLGRVLSRTTAEGTTTYSYGDGSLPISISSPSGTATFVYDESDRLVSVTDANGAVVDYTYLASSAVASVATDNGTATYDVDGDGRTVGVTDVTGTTTFEYDDAGQLVRIVLPDGVTTERTYDGRGRVTRILSASATETVLDLTMTYDATGGVATEADAVAGTTTAYGYDAVGRLLSETVTGGPAPYTATYDLDAVGNRVLRNHSTEGTTTYAYDGSDRLLSSTTGGAQIAYGYDANGNRISETGPDGTTLFGWSSLGQLVSQVDTPAGASATVTRHTYGPTGLRIATDSGGDHQTFTFDRARPVPQVLEERDSTGALLARSTLGPDRVARTTAATTQFLHGDRLGSVVATTSPSGAVDGRSDYDAFGTVVSRAGADLPFGFAGERQGPDGLVDLRARWMDPSTGGFLSRDPAAGFQTDPRSMHDYLYAYGDPVNLTDPTGLNPTLTEISISFAIAASISAIGVGVIGATQKGKRLDWDGPTYDFGVEYGALDFGVGVNLLSATNRGHRTDGQFLVLTVGVGVGLADAVRAGTKKAAGRRAEAQSYFGVPGRTAGERGRKATLAYGEIFAGGLEAFEGLSPLLGVAKGNATVNAPVALGGRFGIDPAVLAPTYLKIEASISTGMIGAAVNQLIGRGAGASNAIAYGAFLQGFGYGLNWGDQSTSNSISFGAAAVAGLSIGITPPSQKHQPIGG